MPVALITGSGRPRIGFEIAKHLARRGMDIAIHFNSSAESAATNVIQLTEIGVKAKAFQADVTEESEVQELVGDVTSHFESLDVLVTTSSIWKSIPLQKVSSDDVIDSFKVNTLGTFLCCKYAGAVMVEQKSGGNMITIGDSLIDHPYVGHSAYFTAKGAIPTLTRALAVELAVQNPNVRVNCIHPGPVMLPSGMSVEEQQDRVDSTLSKEADNPKAVVQTVAFLIDNPMITGSCIYVDGGRNVGLENLRRNGRT